LSTQRIYAFRIMVALNTDHFPVQH